MKYKDHITKFDYVDARDARIVKFNCHMGEETRKLNTSWFRGNGANFLPMKKDLEAGFDKYFFEGLVPQAPFINTTSSIVTTGSCFAKEINVSLAERGFVSLQKPNKVPNKQSILKVPEAIIGGVNNTFTIRQLMEWVWLNIEPVDETWHGDDKSVIERNEQYRQETADRFNNTDLFIIVIGLSEVWCNRETGDVFWKAIPYTQYDETKHEFRNTSVEENKDNIGTIIDLISTNAPQARIVFMIDPVPLEATFRPMNCVAADAVSKAVIRVALDEILRDCPDNVFYFPVYELVKNYYIDPYQDDNRHPKQELITDIVDHFCRFYVNARTTDT